MVDIDVGDIYLRFEDAYADGKKQERNSELRKNCLPVRNSQVIQMAYLEW